MTNKFSGYMPIVFRYATVIVIAVLATHIYDKNGLEKRVFKEIGLLKELGANLKTDVDINRSLLSREEIRISVIGKIQEMVEKYSGSFPASNKLSTEDIIGVADVIMEKYELNKDLVPSLTVGLIAAESGFNPRIVSSAGAKGLMQVMDLTAGSYLESYGLPQTQEILFDPIVNVRAGLDYLNYLQKRYVAEGKSRTEALHLALLRYNRGEPAMRELLDDPLGLRYTDRISQIQAEIRESGVI